MITLYKLVIINISLIYTRPDGLPIQAMLCKMYFNAKEIILPSFTLISTLGEILIDPKCPITSENGNKNYFNVGDHIKQNN